MAEVGVLRVSLGLDSANFTKNISEINRKLKAVESEFKAVGGSVKGFENTLEGLRAKSDMLTKKIDLQSARVQELKRRYEESAATKGKEAAETEKLLIAYNKAVGDLKKLENELQQTDSKLNKLSHEINQNVSDWDRLRGKLNDVGQRLQDIGGRIQSAGQDIATSFGAASLAIGGALGFAVKKSMDFEAQIDRVGAISGANAEELKALEKSALDLGASTSKSATEVAQAQEIMATMGYKTNEIIAALPGVIAAAEASGEDMALVADTVSSALNAFGLSASEASRVADVLAQAANDSAAGIQDMQYTFKYAAPVAKQLGISLEQLAAATEIMSNAGIKGEQAGTTLRSALLRLSDPPKEAAEALAELGIKITDSQGKMLPFGNIIEQIKNKTEGMGNAQKTAALSAIFGTEAVSGMLAVVEAGPQKLDQLTKSLQNSSGASQEAAQKMKNNLKGSLEELQGAFETAQITIGNALAPAIQKIAEVLQGLINWFNQLSPATQKFIAIGAAVTAILTGMVAVFGVILTVIGGAVNGFGALTGAFGFVAQAISKAGGMMGVLRTALAAITGPIGIAIAAITGLTIVFVKLYKENETFRNKVNQIWENIKSAFSVALTYINSIVQTVMNTVRTFISAKLSEIKAFWQQNGDQIKQAAQNAWSFISKVIQGAMTVISAVMKVAWPVIKALIVSTWEAIKGVINGAINVILGVIKTFSAILTGDWKGAWEGVKNIIKGAVQFVWNLVNLMFIGKVLGGIKAFGTSLLSSVGSMWTGVKTIFSSSINTIKTVFTSGFNFLKSFVNSPIGTIKNIISNGFSTMKTTVSNKMTEIKSAIETGWNRAVSFLKNIDLFAIGKNIMQGLLRGITNMIGAIQEKVKEVANSVLKTFKSVLDIHSPSRETEKIGKHTGEGFVKGIESKKKDAEAAARKAAATAKKGFEQAFQNIQLRFDAKIINAEQAIYELEKLKAKYKEVPNAVAKVNKEIYEINKAHAKELEELAKKRFESDKKWFEDKKYYNQLSLIDELKNLEFVAKKYKKGSEERQYWEREIYRVKKEIHDKMTELNNEYAEKVKEINERLYQDELKAKEEYEQKVKEINDRLIDEERRLTEEYEKAVEDRTKSLYNFVGIFDEIKRKDDLTGQGLLKNLSDQVTVFRDWQANIISLAARGIDDGLLKELREMGPKAVDEIAALNSLSDTELQQYVAIWREKNALAKAQAVNELEGMRLETQTKIQQLRATANVELEQVRIEYINKIAQLRAQANAELELHKNEWMAKVKEISEGTKTELNLMSASMSEIGKNSMQGLIDGLNSMIGPLRAKAKEIADIVQNTVKNTLKIKSPSRVMMELGGWIPIGLAEGIANNIKAVTAQANLMARAAIPTVPRLNNSMALGSGSTQTNNITKYGNVNINVTIPVSDLEQIKTVNDFFNRLGMKVKQA
jgi:TP901 family phage tail tape measure protein